MFGTRILDNPAQLQTAPMTWWEASSLLTIGFVIVSLPLWIMYLAPHSSNFQLLCVRHQFEQAGLTIANRNAVGDSRRSWPIAPIQARPRLPL